jgi:hypothetical protein
MEILHGAHAGKCSRKVSLSISTAGTSMCGAEDLGVELNDYQKQLVYWQSV